MATQVLVSREKGHEGIRPGGVRGEGPHRAAGFPSTGPAHVSYMGMSSDAARILDELHCEIEQNPAGARTAVLRLMALLSPPAQVEHVAARGGLAPWQQRKVDQYVRERLEHPVRVQDLAEQARLSVSYFCRAFKASFGDTPHGYIVELRLRRAQQLMLTTREPLCQVALACGFAHQAHLSKLFRQKLGESPNAWRRRNLNDVSHEVGGHRTTRRYQC